MNLSKVSYVQTVGVAMFLIVVALLVASFSGKVKVTVTPSDAKADGGGGVQHISGLFMPDESSVGPTKLGAAGSEFSSRLILRDNEVVGGFDFATSSTGAATYTAVSINNARVIEHIAATALTATLPTNAALSAVGFLPNVGDTQTFFIHASTTKITLAGNTGVTLASASTTKDISPGLIGRIECSRLGATEARGIWCLLMAD